MLSNTQNRANHFKTVDFWCMTVTPKRGKKAKVVHIHTCQKRAKRIFKKFQLEKNEIARLYLVQGHADKGTPDLSKMELLEERTQETNVERLQNPYELPGVFGL